VLEYILLRREQLFHPLIFFFSGIFYTILSAVLAVLLFPSQPSITHILLTTIAVAPLLFEAVSFGARIIDEHPESTVHIQVWLLVLYSAYLLGAILGFQTVYTFFPEPERSMLMAEQVKELSIIEGVRVELSGMAAKPGAFNVILTNNLNVYLIAILLSFLYGTGGVLLLNWNASIISALFYQRLSAGSIGSVVSSILGILPHATFEFLGYFIGGMTGIYLGVAIIQEGWSRRLLRDVIILFILGIASIFFGALLEAGYF
jgi:uncharacterized membrane protein SpoIIM required for sporulation